MLTSTTEFGINEHAGNIYPGDTFEYQGIIYIAVNLLEQDSRHPDQAKRYSEDNLYGVDLRDGRIHRISNLKVVQRITDLKLYR